MNTDFKENKVEKSCDTCRYDFGMSCYDIVGGCDKGSYQKWEPKEGKRECRTCGHENNGVCHKAKGCDKDYSNWQPVETKQITNTNLGDSSMSKERNYEAIVQAVDEDGKIVGKVRTDPNVSAIMHVVATSEQDARDQLNRKFPKEINGLKEKGEVEFIIRPFLSS